MRLFPFALIILATSVQAQNTKLVRLLLLDTAGIETPDDERLLLAESVTNALRGHAALLVATSKDVKLRAPLIADRLLGCEEELCLYEAADVMAADFVLFSSVRVRDGLRYVEIGAYDAGLAEIVVREKLKGTNIAELVASIDAAMQRVIEPILLNTRRNLFEEPTFLTGAGLSFVGFTAVIGGLGWALEMDTALADPARHRDQKEFALQNGKRAFWIAGLGTIISAAGVFVLGHALTEER